MPKNTGYDAEPENDRVPASWRVLEELRKEYLSLEGQWGSRILNGINSLLEQEVPDILWHYSSFSAFEAIVRTKKIFMSDLNTMNDYKEGQWIRNLLIDRLSQSSFMIRTFLEYLNSTQIGFNIGPYVLSLSAGGDLLSQWRSYADGGKGVAIGLAPLAMQVPLFKLEREQHPGLLTLSNVIYDAAAHESVVDAIYALIESLVRNYYSRRIKFDFEQHPFIPCAAYINLYLRYIEPVFKNPAFQEEREWRLIYFPKASLLNTWKKQISSLELSEGDDKNQIKFRFRPDNISSYFEFPRETSLVPLIKGVKLGPLCNAKKEMLALFLLQSGASDFNIEQSVATLR